MKRTTLYITMFALIWTLPSGTGAQTSVQRGSLFEEFQESLTGLPPKTTLSKRGTIYVPAYSSIFVDSRAGRVSLATTLTIHNTSAKAPLVIERIDYFDSAGNGVKEFLDSPIALRPYATIAVLVTNDIDNGGMGANFKVIWAASAAVPVPAVEAIMMGRLGTNSYSFVSPGRSIETVESP